MVGKSKKGKVPTPKRIKRRTIAQPAWAGPRRIHVAAVRKLTSSEMLELLTPLDKSDDLDVGDAQAIFRWVKSEGLFLVEYLRALRAAPGIWHDGKDTHKKERDAVMLTLRALLVQDPQTIENMDDIGKLGLSGSQTFEQIVKYMIARIETSGGDRK